MLQGEHSAILSTFIKLAFVIKIIVLSIVEEPFYTGFTVPFAGHGLIWSVWTAKALARVTVSFEL